METMTNIKIHYDVHKMVNFPEVRLTKGFTTKTKLDFKMYQYNRFEVEVEMKLDPKMYIHNGTEYTRNI